MITSDSTTAAGGPKWVVDPPHLVASDRWPVAEDERPTDHRARAFTAADVLVSITTQLPDYPVTMWIDDRQAIRLHVMASYATVAELAARLGLTDVSVKEVEPWTISTGRVIGGSTLTHWTGTYDGHKVQVEHCESHEVGQ